MEKIAPFFSRIDKSFDESRTRDYELVLQVTGTSCGYSLFDKDQNIYIALESYDIPLSGLVNQNEWIKSSFRSVRVLVENNRSTLIPAVLFEESEPEAYLNFSLEQGEDEKALFDKMDRIDVVNIFGMSRELYDETTRNFPDAKICHLTSHLIESIRVNFKNLISEKQIFICIRQSDFNILIFDKKQLIYSNAFHFRAPEDVAYFVIFVMEQLDLNPEEIPVTLLGNIRQDSPEFELLFRYIRHVDFASRNDNLNYSNVFDDVPGHDWYSLLNPVQCGS